MSCQRHTKALVAVVCAAALIVPALAGAAGWGFLSSWGAAGKSSGAFDGPDGVAVDSAGHVYVADRDNNRIQKFSFDGRFLARLGRNGGDGSAGVGNGEFNRPRGVATDGLGNLWVADSANNRIEKFSPAGAFLGRFGRHGGDGSAGTGPGEFNDPRGIATDAAGNLYVADHGNNRIQKLAPDGRFLARFGRNGGDGSAGTGPGELWLPRGVAVDRAGDIYVADKGNNRIQELGPAGQFVRKWGRSGGDGSSGRGSGEFRAPYSVAIDPFGHVFVADPGNNRLQEFTATGVFLARFGRGGGDGSAGGGPGEFRGAYGVAADCRGGVYATDEGNDRVERFGQAGLTAPVCPAKLELAQLRGRVSRIGGVRLRVRCDRACVVHFAGRVLVGRRTVARFSRLVRAVPGDTVLTVRLRLNRAPRRQVARLLRAGVHAIARVTASATSFGGRASRVSARRRLVW